MTPEDHALLAGIESSTPMGSLLRRYWLPACLSSELEAGGAPVRVRLLGEPLIAFRDTEGRVGLLREFCAHRGASLYFARNAESGLRCWYHGWKYDTDGNCLDQPNMPVERRFCDKLKQPAYPCIEKNGVVWSYLGPREVQPPLHELEWLTVPESHVYVSKRIQACHWTQGMEGDMDPSHLAFLHTDAIKESLNHGQADSGAWLHDDLTPRVELEETEAGLILASRRNAGPEEYFWRIGQWFFPTFTTIPAFPGNGPLMGHSWTPIEYGRTAVYTFIWHPVRPLGPEERARIAANPDMHAALIPGTFLPLANATNDFARPDGAPARQPWMRIKPFQDQDMAATCSMGPLYDRTAENLCVQDIPIVTYRRRMCDAARALQRGMAPPGRDPSAYRLRPVSVKLPRSVNSWVRACAEAMDTRPETFQASV